jgi:hypothetical protein
VNFDVYNALNANPVLRQNDNYAACQAPTVILAARLFKIGVQFDFLNVGGLESPPLRDVRRAGF